MKKILTFLLFSLVGLICFAQNDVYRVISSEKTIGKDFITNSEIEAKEYILSEYIYDFYFDSVTNLFVLQLRGISENKKYFNNDGELLVFDPIRSDIKWSKDVNYFADSYILCVDKLINLTRNKSIAYDINTGIELWRAKDIIFYYDTLSTTALGYKIQFAGGYDHKIEAIDIKTGNPKWKRKMFGMERVQNIFNLNDSILLIDGGGLHSVNINDGNGWNYIKRNSLFSSDDIISNVLIDSYSLYFAFDDEIVKLDDSGNKIWSSMLPKSIEGHMLIGKIDNLIYVINSGGINGKNNENDKFKPYIAGFDLNFGKNIYLNRFEKEGYSQIINDYDIKDYNLFLLFKDRLVKTSLLDGKVIKEKVFDIQKYGELSAILSKNVYTQSDSIYFSLKIQDSMNHFVQTKTGNVLIINQDFEISKVIDIDFYYLKYAENKDYKLIGNKRETMIINNDGKKIGEIKAGNDSKLIGNKLYVVQGKSFIVIDLTKFSK